MEGNQLAAKLSKLSGASSLEVLEEEERELIQLRILEEKRTKEAPRWMKYYHIVSYIVYGIIALYSLFYLVFIGIYQAHPRMQIQYLSIVRFLEYNSYSILSPLLCPVFMGMLAYHVKKRYLLEEGDFFGVIGFLLLLALINVHDGWGIYQQVAAKPDSEGKIKSLLDPPPRDNSSRNVFHWQYAWSTRTPCAKIFVRKLIYQQDYDKRHVKRQILFDLGEAKGRNLMEDTVAELTTHENCNMYHDYINDAQVRPWMIDMQREFKCCGPYGYDKWRRWFLFPNRTGCDWESVEVNKGPDIPGCYTPLIEWLNKILWSTFWIMYMQATLYIVAIIFAVAHHRVMRFEQQKAAKAHSLLDMTKPEEEYPWWRFPRPADDPMVIGTNLFKASKFELEPAKPAKEEENKGVVSSLKPKDALPLKKDADNKSQTSHKKKVRTQFQ